jgi:hypothetical protein
MVCRKSYNQILSPLVVPHSLMNFTSHHATLPSPNLPLLPLNLPPHLLTGTVPPPLMPTRQPWINPLKFHHQLPPNPNLSPLPEDPHPLCLSIPPLLQPLDWKIHHQNLPHPHPMFQGASVLVLVVRQKTNHLTLPSWILSLATVCMWLTHYLRCPFVTQHLLYIPYRLFQPSLVPLPLLAHVVLLPSSTVQDMIQL